MAGGDYPTDVWYAARLFEYHQNLLPANRGSCCNPQEPVWRLVLRPKALAEEYGGVPRGDSGHLGAHCPVFGKERAEAPIPDTQHTLTDMVQKLPAEA